ncbi:MAG TPA: IS1595 family transposase, partial [Stellaceae bacterium]|nr:IS1595 family transposase [Stellaceae bacterium]
MTHFLLTPAARSLSIAQVCRLSDEEAFDTFKRLRFAANGGEPFCPHCGILKVYTLAETPIRWKCSGCRRKFSVTSGTLFHGRKLSIRDYLAVIALFANGVKGVSALQMSRNMNVGPKAIFVLLHKLREAMASTISDRELSGEGEVDGAYFGARTRQTNRKGDRRQQRSDTRQVVVVARERRGDAVAWVVPSERDAVPLIRQTFASGTVIHADEAGAWNVLRAS